MKKYLNTARHRPSTAAHTEVIAATQSDRARLIYSAAFRRLQQKAQVFSLESNSAVRSRLSHSIEVSHIGRYIVATITEKILSATHITQDDKDYWINNSLAIANIVEVACLAHDIGNPPFGHFGEAAIVQWSSSSEIKKAMSQSFNGEISEDNEINPLLNDFINFDGNPQGLRILTKLQGDDGFYGLNLTYSQLASFLKYTFSPNDKSLEKDKNQPFSKKIGFFDSEKDIIEAAWKQLDMSPNKRHPLGFLMEASDDISYCISDIEDGIEKDIITEIHFSKEISTQLKSLKSKYEQHEEYSIICEELIEILTKEKKGFPIGSFLSFKTKISNFLVKKTAEKFIEKYNKFISLEVDEEIISKGTFEYNILKLLKDYTLKYLFTSFEAEKMELSGFAIIKGILDEYLKIISLSKEEFSHIVLTDFDEMRNCKLHIERRLFNRLPKKHINAYKTAIVGLPLNSEKWSDALLKSSIKEISKEKEWHLRVHLVVDFVSGMTDQFSMDTYQLLKGINIR